MHDILQTRVSLNKTFEWGNIRSSHGDGRNWHKKVRIANLLPKTDLRTTRASLAHCGEIRDIQEEQWSKAYRYAVANGFRIVVITVSTYRPTYA